MTKYIDYNCLTPETRDCLNAEWLACDCGTGGAVGVGHFYSPYPDRYEMQADTRFYEKAVMPSLTGIDIREQEQIDFFKSFASQDNKPKWTQTPSSKNRYYYNNGSFEAFDVAAMKAIIATYKPQKWVEVGSGFSTAALLDVCDACHYNIKIDCIEPYPAYLERLLRPKDEGRFVLHQTSLQEAPLSLFKDLESNDIAFFDCSHVAKFGSDVNRMFGELLPTLRKGVIVHIHDIFYPFEYPKQWIYHDRRAWNEAYILRAFLYANTSWKIIFWADWFKQCRPEIHEKHHPLSASYHCGSIWLQKVE